jgi:hypothetical protein
MELRGSSQCSQQWALLETTESSPLQFPYEQFAYNVPIYAQELQSGIPYLPSTFPTKPHRLYAHLTFPMHASCSVQLTRFHFVFLSFYDAFGMETV